MLDVRERIDLVKATSPEAMQIARQRAADERPANAKAILGGYWDKGMFVIKHIDAAYVEILKAAQEAEQ